MSIGGTKGQKHEENRMGSNSTNERSFVEKQSQRMRHKKDGPSPGKKGMAAGELL